MSKTILIIEDELKIRFLLRDYLKAEGFNVLEASDGDEGIFIFKNNKVDLILLDIMMPKIDGITVLETIRTVSNLPIILLTAKGQEEDKLFGYEMGADDYVTKPFSPKILIAKIKALLKRTTNNDDDFNPKFKKMKKKVCPLCGDKNFVLDFKNSDQLRKFVNDKGKILPRRTTGACAKHQRDITIAVKRARQIAILPYTQE